MWTLKGVPSTGMFIFLLLLAFQKSVLYDWINKLSFYPDTLFSVIIFKGLSVLCA